MYVYMYIFINLCLLMIRGLGTQPTKTWAVGKDIFLLCAPLA